MKKIKKEIHRISAGPEVVLLMARGRCFTNKKIQAKKMACRRRD